MTKSWRNMWKDSGQVWAVFRSRISCLICQVVIIWIFLGRKSWPKTCENILDTWLWCTRKKRKHFRWPRFVRSDWKRGQKQPFHHFLAERAAAGHFAWQEYSQCKVTLADIHQKWSANKLVENFFSLAKTCIVVSPKTCNQRKTLIFSPLISDCFLIRKIFLIWWSQMYIVYLIYSFQ